MKTECIESVATALGRSVTVAEARNLERRMADAMRREAAADPQSWQALSAGERLQAAAGSAAKELIAEAQKKKVRIAQTIVAHDRMRNYVARQLAEGLDANGFDALSRMMAAKADGKNNVLSVEDIAHGIESVNLGELWDTWEAVHSNFADILSGALGRESQGALEGLLIRALHGEDVGRPEIMKAAQSFHDVAERLRTRFNAAGGEIGKLDNWGHPHSWSADRVAEAGVDGFTEAVLPLLDRRRYVHEDGRPYSDQDLQQLLHRAFVSITTNGANKPLSQVRGTSGGMRSGRHAESRQIHFRDGDAAHKALSQFSDKGVLSAIAGHVKRMAADIALVEQFGPNPDLAVSKLLEEMNQQHRLAHPGRTAEGNADRLQRRTENLYDYLAGNTEQPLQVPLFRCFGWESKYTVAEAFSDLRSLAVASKLGSAVVTSITDNATMHLTAHVNGIPAVSLLRNQLLALNPADTMERRMAGRMGLLTHTMLDELNRWGTTNLNARTTGKIAGTVIRASGLNAITEARRRAYSLSMMDTLGAMTREHATLASLEATDHALLKRTGITEEHWSVWRLAEPDQWRGNDTVLNAQAIYRIPDDQVRAALGVTGSVARIKDQAATALMGFVMREQDMAVIEPGARERAAMHMGTVPGTWKGELLRTFFLFKSFPIAMLNRHLGRAFGAEFGAGARTMYGTALLAGTTVLGCLALEINDVLNGKDPRSLNPLDERGGRNWLAGLLKGGALGIYGDLLFTDPTENGQSYTSMLLGPGAGAVEQAAQLTLGNMNQAAKGEKTHAGAEVVRFVKGNTPGANLWYTKAATDHLIFQRLQEYFSPGYMRKMKQRAQRDYGSSYWWEPGAPAPQRAPDLGEAASP